MAFGFCYDPATRCRSICQPGVQNYRDVVREVLGLGSFGCLNCRDTRTGNTLSLHGEGRADDTATPITEEGLLDLDFNTRFGNFLVAAAQDLGIQRDIGWGPRYDGSVGPREWDSRNGERYWEPYFGPLHKDHNHVEFCWDAALHLTKDQVRAAIAKYWLGVDEEDELNATEKQQLEDAYNAVFVFRKPEGADKEKRYEHLNIIEAQNRAICKHLGIDLDAVGLPVE